jgi:N-methylhydantoinase B
MTNTANAPIEITELEHPVRIEKLTLLDDSGGAGKYRGGLGMTREVIFLAEGDATALLMRPHIKPYGLYGGEGGKTDAGGVLLSDGNILRFSKNVKPGNRLFIRTSGGGGWGNPLERDIEKVEWDALNGYISLESAREKYGCLLDPQTFRANHEKTGQLRNKLNVTHQK